MGLRSPLAFVPESVLIPSKVDGVPMYIHEHILPEEPQICNNLGR